MSAGTVTSRRLAAIALGALVVVLGSPAAAFALAGGGSGGFGGGGGGGGGGLFGGGGADDGKPAHGGTGSLILGGALVLAVLVYGWVGIVRASRSHRSDEGRPPLSWSLLLATLRRVLLWPLDLALERRRLGPRRRRVALAAAEAAADDERFDPETVRTDADWLFRTIQALWSAGDRAGLARLVAPDLMVEWDRRLADFAQRGWRNVVDVRGSVHVDYVGLRNAAQEDDRRVTVRLTANVNDNVVDRSGVTIHRREGFDLHNICEYWTLGLRDGRWTLVSVEQHREGLHRLEEPIVASPWADDAALRRAATLEQAAANRTGDGELAALAPAGFAHDARIAALDLSLVDDRFAPALLSAEVEHAVRAWVEAVDGDDAALGAVATPAAVAQLLYRDAGHRERVVVRGPRVRVVRIVELAAHETPAWLLVELEVVGRRYVEDRDTLVVVEGDRSTDRAFTQRWRMELTGDDARPWRIAAVVDAQPAAP